MTDANGANVDLLEQYYNNIVAGMAKRRNPVQGTMEIDAEKFTIGCDVGDLSNKLTAHFSFPPMLIVRKSFHFDDHWDTYPFPGVACYLTLTKGCILVNVIKIQDLLEQKTNIAGIADFLDKASSTAFCQKGVQVLLTAGAGPTTVWVPECYAAIAMSIHENQADDDKEFEGSAYILEYVFGDGEEKYPSPVVVDVEAKAKMTLAQSKKRCIVNSKDRIEKWLALWAKRGETKSDDVTIPADINT